MVWSTTLACFTHAPSNKCQGHMVQSPPYASLFLLSDLDGLGMGTSTPTPTPKKKPKKHGPRGCFLVNLLNRSDISARRDCDVPDLMRVFEPFSREPCRRTHWW